ncbi:glycosyltransferase family 2 protein [Flavobacterium sp.]|uniref:glycosyltransferase family 2 protein n=1 Tax=Flavobacterium sp. TaxID=239 RepID=UPI003D2760B5
MIVILLTILIIYLLFISALLFGFCKITKNEVNALKPKTTFSIVVPFRNEADNLPKLLHTISLLNYPKELFEIILVDDESYEEFRIQNLEFRIQVIKNIRKSNSPKKDAIETAIEIAKNDWIITTDADCLVQKDWLLSIDNYIQNSHLKMIAAGVTYLPKKGFLAAFQTLDFMSLQGATLGSFGIGKPFMCNGANFAYSKSFFQELNGFNGNENIASGDDVFLLQKAVLKAPKSVGFLYDSKSIVATQTVNTWKELFMQRVRWAAKSTGYNSLFGKLLALIVFAANLCWILVFTLWLIGKLDQNYFMLFIGSKFLVDLILLQKTAHFFKTKLSWILASSFLYPIFSSSVALYALFGKYEWKGRTFNK